MKKSRFTEEQIAFALRQAETGTSAREVCRKMGISEQTFYRWKKKSAGVNIASLLVTDSYALDNKRDAIAQLRRAQGLRAAILHSRAVILAL